MDTITRSEKYQKWSTDEISLARYITLLEVFLSGLQTLEKTLAKMQLIKGVGEEAEIMDFMEEHEFKSHYLYLDNEYNIGTVPSDFFPYTNEAAKTVINKIETSITNRRKELQNLVQEKENKLHGTGTVYLIGSARGRILKIGYTKNLEKRLNQLQAKSSCELEIIKTKKGTRETEKETLAKFKEFQLLGELFVWDESIISQF